MSKKDVRDSLENGTLRSALRRKSWSDSDIDYLIEIAEEGIFFLKEKPKLLRLFAAIRKHLDKTDEVLNQ